MHWIDWTIVVVLIAALIGITVYSKRYVRGVADFLAANRLAGRYLLTVSSGFGGAISLVAMWEMTYNAGLPTSWWSMMGIPLGLIIALTGFVVYRFRQTRALTLAQFLEMRYSRKFRFYAGSLCWLSGIFNYGVFPAVTARFIIFFFRLPESFQVMGINISMFPTVMLVYLAIACYIACAGGQISIMITDFFQGMMMMVIFIVIMFFLLAKFQWADIIAGLQMAPEGKSMINPFKTSDVSDFNIWYFLIGLFGAIYSVRAWQGNSGYNAAAKTPHEAVLAGIISTWRGFANTLCMTLIPLAAFAVLHLPAFASLAAPINAEINAISDPMLKNQMTVPLFLANILPVGIMGLFAAIVVACAISCDDTYVHAWGSIFVQDMILPMRKKPLTPKQHMLLLRTSIIGIAVFGFTFSMLFPLKDFILMYFALTGAIYLGGAGSIIIGGLYWKRGTTAAAWTSLTVGTILGFGGLMIQQIWKPYLAPFVMNTWPDWAWMAQHQDKFPLNGQIIFFFAMAASIVCYVAVSLLGPKHVFNMDKMLHRGKYAIKEDIATGDEPVTKSKFSLSSLIGITPEFNKFERFISFSTFFWSMGWWAIFMVGTLIALTTNWLTDKFWCDFWWWQIIPFSVVLGTICTIWITVGGLRDVKRLFQDLRAERVDDGDDGTVNNEEDNTNSPPKDTVLSIPAQANAVDADPV